MARVINIDINADTTTAVRNIEDLENTIEQLTAELRGVDIGSAEFERLSGEIANARGELRNLEFGFEGLDREQRVTATAGALGGLASAATVVAGTFAAIGVESEVFENIETQVIGLIGITQGIAGVAAGYNDLIRIFPSLITAQGTFNATALLNPYLLAGVAIIATVTLLVSLLGDGANETERAAMAAERERREQEMLLDIQRQRRDVARQVVLNAERGDRTNLNNAERLLELDIARGELTDDEIYLRRRGLINDEIEILQNERDQEINALRDFYDELNSITRDANIETTDIVENAQNQIMRVFMVNAALATQTNEEAREDDMITLTQRLNNLNAFIQRNAEVFEFIGIGTERLARISFNIEKAATLSDIALSAPEAVQSAFTTATASPLTLAFPAYPYIVAGAAGAFSAAQFAAAASVQFGGGIPSTPAPATPATPTQAGIPNAQQLQTPAQTFRTPAPIFSANGISDAQNESNRRARRGVF